MHQLGICSEAAARSVEQDKQSGPYRVEHTALHEECMGCVQLPGLMLAAEVHALLQNGLDLAVVLHIPIDARLAHQHCNTS